MKEITLVFTTRHRNGYAVERDCILICRCINLFTTRYKYLYNGKGLIVFHVYNVEKKAHKGLLAELLDRMNSLTYYKSLDLQSYTCK